VFKKYEVGAAGTGHLGSSPRTKLFTGLRAGTFRRPRKRGVEGIFLISSSDHNMTLLAEECF